MKSNNVVTIDCGYMERPRFAAAFLIRDGDRGVFVENNTAHAVPRLLEAARDAGVAPERVDFVIITHVHLDHAGGTSALLAACPNAKLLAHPRAARHAIDPSRLVESARKVYGDAEFERLYGEINPVDASRVREMADGERVEWGGRELEFLHTRGHANHHFCVFDPLEGSIFTGDSFGLCYPALQGGGLFIFPSTSPTDFDPVEARASLDRILATGARRAMLTHFGEVARLGEAADQLRSHLDFSERVLDDAIASPLSGDALTKQCLDRLVPRFREELDRRGLGADREAWNLIALDLDLNAQGIAFVAEKRRNKDRKSP